MLLLLMLWENLQARALQELISRTALEQFNITLLLWVGLLASDLHGLCAYGNLLLNES